MAKVLVMTDNVACIPQELAEENRIKVVPTANIIFDGYTYVEGVNINATEAYQLIKKDPDRFVTSAVTPDYLLDEYRKLSMESQDILLITLASALSAFFKTASLAADLFREESPKTTIRILDSRTCAGAQGLVALAAARAAASGMDLDGVANIAEQARKQTGGIMFLDTLRYIYRTGRMSKTASRVISLLNIKPINRVTDEGTVELVTRARKREDGYKKLLEAIKHETGTNSLHFIVSHAAAPEWADRLSELLKQEFDCLSLIISDYSPVMGYGAGPGALFVGFHPELDLSKQ
jgi:DegV family protein with EDD domain